MLESIFNGAGTETITFIGLIAALGTALVIGLLMSLVYVKTTQAKSQNFAVTLVVLPIVVAVIILMIGNSVARAFSLAGAFTIIRFRSIPTTPKDILYVLFSMAIGLAIGMGFLFYAAIVAVVLCVIMVVLEKTNYAANKAAHKILKITMPEDTDFETEFNEVFDYFTISHDLRKIKTDALGSLYKLTYAVVLKENADIKGFIDELRVHNGNLNISLNADFEGANYAY